MVIAVSMGSLLIALEASVTQIMPHALVETFSSDISTMSWFSIAYLVSGTGLMLSMGWLGDVLGQRRMYLAGLVIFTVGLGFVSVSQNIPQLIAARIFQAIGMGLVLANASAIITAMFPGKHERGKALGVLSGIVGIGLCVGPLLGGLLLQYMDWRAVYWVRIPLATIALPLAFMFIHDQRTNRREPLNVDYLGMVLLYSTIVLSLIAVNLAGRWGISSLWVWSIAAMAAIHLPILILVERRATRPILDLDLFKIRGFSVSLATFVLHFIAFGGLLFLSPFYLQDGLGTSAMIMGFTIAIIAAGRAIIGLPGGLLYGKLGATTMTFVGLIAMLAAFLGISLVAVEINLWMIVFLFAIIGIGTTLFDISSVAAIMGMVPRSRLGTASASIVTSAQTAISMGIALSGALFTLRISSHTLTLSDQGVKGADLISAATKAAYGDVILVLVVVLAFASVVTLLRGKT
jgi:MFS family permease